MKSNDQGCVCMLAGLLDVYQSVSKCLWNIENVMLFWNADSVTHSVIDIVT